jgi:hypothetical protein
MSGRERKLSPLRSDDPDSLETRCRITFVPRCGRSEEALRMLHELLPTWNGSSDRPPEAADRGRRRINAARRLHASGDKDGAKIRE